MVVEKLLDEKMLKRTQVFNGMMESEIKIYKIIKAVYKVIEELLFTVHKTGARGHQSKLSRNQFKRPPRLVTQTLPCTAFSIA